MAGRNEEWFWELPPGCLRKGGKTKKKRRIKKKEKSTQLKTLDQTFLEVGYRKLRPWGFISGFLRAGGWRGAERETAASTNQLVLGRT